jgi:biopolymer transport protein ExbD
LAALQFTRSQAIGVDLPKASTGSTPQMRQMLIVSIDPTGKTFVDKAQVNRNNL